MADSDKIYGGGMQDAATMPLSWRHIWIVFVASLGQLIGTVVATVVGVIIPLLNIRMHPELSSFMQGLIGCIDLVGIAIGSMIFGRLSDRYGYLPFFRLCPALIFIFSLIAILASNVVVLTLALFFVGLAIGGEYSLDSDYVSELMPIKWRALMVGLTKTASAVGNIIAAALCLWFLLSTQDAALWSQMMWIVAGLAALMLILRIRFWESPAWLIDQGRTQQAQFAVQHFLGNNVMLRTDSVQKTTSVRKTGTLQFVKENWKNVILSGVPWACEGLGVYGIGIFLPILVMALGLEHFYPGEPEVLHVAESVRITLWISCIMLPGFLIGLWLIRRKRGLVAIQSIGFWLCAVSLVILLLAYDLNWNKWVSIGAFMAFELFLNMGPHLITYVLPPHIYPVETRGQGVGIAAAIGKIGAVLGVFFIPMLLKWGGATLVLIVSVVVMTIGALVTNIFGRSTNNAG